jgi:hypothetical protein
MKRRIKMILAVLLSCVCSSCTAVALAGCNGSGSDANIGTNLTDSTTKTDGKTSETHTLTQVAEKAATCTTAGNVAYYTCGNCDKWFEDEGGTKEIADHDAVTVAAKGHNMQLHDGVAATCTNAGNVAYYTCGNCDKWFEDEGGTKEIADHDAVTVAALNHDLQSHAEKAATCVEVGWNAYESCSRCDYTTYSEKPLIDHNYVDAVCSVCGKEKQPTEGLEYTLSSDETYYIVSGIGTATDTDIIIASTYNDLPVKEIADRAFMNNATIKSVIIPASVETIGASGFASCESLETIIIPDSVTSVVAGVFQRCNNLKFNEYDNGCYLGNSHNPYLLLFKAKSTDITSCEINENTKCIYGSAFANCSSLTEITIPNGVVTIADSAFSSCSGLTSITIPDSVTCIGGSAFSYCSSLQSATLSQNITSIADMTFYNCSSLQSVIVPDKVTSIGMMAFSSCNGLKTVTLGSGVTSIGSNAFSSCMFLASINIPDGVTSIGGSAFYACAFLESINLPDSVTSIGSYAFYSCSSIKSVVIPDGITTIESYSFAYCYGLKTVTIGNGVTSIGSNAFTKCSNLKVLTIGSEVTSISQYAFMNCSALETIIIGNKITTIGSFAFYNCNSSAVVYYKGTAEDWAKISGGDSSYNIPSTRYYYSEDEPNLNADGTDYDGNYWCYDEDGEPVVWTKG